MRWKSRRDICVSLFPPLRLLVKAKKGLSQEYQSFNNANLMFLVENSQTIPTGPTSASRAASRVSWWRCRPSAGSVSWRWTAAPAGWTGWAWCRWSRGGTSWTSPSRGSGSAWSWSRRTRLEPCVQSNIIIQLAEYSCQMWCLAMCCHWQ